MDKLLTTHEAADLLHCHPQTVYRNKELPHVMIPGIGKRYRLDEHEQLLAERGRGRKTLVVMVNETKTMWWRFIAVANLI